MFTQVILTFLVVLAFLGILTAFIFYALYCWSPEKIWRDRVLQFFSAANRRLRRERDHLDSLPHEQQAEQDALREDALTAFLRDISVDDLQAYPGIGPVTIAKLRGGGWSNLASLRNAHIRVPGIGQKRLADLGAAVGAVVRQARNRLDAGACAYSAELESRLRAVGVKFSKLADQAQAQVGAAEAVLSRIQAFLPRARQVTFYGYLRRQFGSEIPSVISSGPLPDLNRLIRAVEEKVGRPYGQGTRAGLSPQRTETSANEAIPSAIPLSEQEAPEKAARLVPGGPRSMSSTMEKEIEIDFLIAARGGVVEITTQQPAGREASMTQCLRIHIPAGIAEGACLRLKEQGPGGGDLFLKVRIRKDDTFRRQGQDLILEVPVRVTAADLIRRCRVKVPTIDGMVTVKIPSGAKNGQRLRLPGYGLPVPGQQSRGDQYIHLSVGANRSELRGSVPDGGSPTHSIETPVTPQTTPVKPMARLQDGTTTEAPSPAASTPPEPQHQTQQTREEATLIIMELNIQFAFAAARTDGHLAIKEKEIILEDVRRRFQYDTALYNRARNLCVYYETAAIDVDQCLDRIAESFTERHRASLLEFACRIAEACGDRNRKEQEFLQKVAQRWRVPLPPARHGKQPKPPDKSTEGPRRKLNERPHEVSDRQRLLQVLEIDPAVAISADLIRRQFNLLSERWSQEKAQSLGSEFVDIMQRKREAVLAAAEALLKPLGEKLCHTAPEAAESLRPNPDLDNVFGV